MHEVLAFGLMTFTTFVPMIDPFGNMSIFAALTDGMPRRAVRHVAVRATLVALGAVLLFAYFGEAIFELFGITIDGLKIVGGILFGIMGYDMLQAKVSRTKVSSRLDVDERAQLDDIAVTPLAIPLLCGPGAMTHAMLQASKASTPAQQAGFVVGTLAIMAFTLACLLGSGRIARMLGSAGSKVLLRLMGLLLMVIAVESFFSGLTPIVRGMVGG